jgi:hypothetical protein
MTTPQQPAEGTCGRCHQPRRVHPAKSEWGRVPAHLCATCWGRYDEARANDDYVDWNDAFDNASDEEISANLFGSEA